MKWFFATLTTLLLAMLYWSSLVIEESLVEIRRELKDLKTSSSQASVHGTEQAHRPHIQETLPNLLKTDPFFAEKLPHLLPADFVAKGIRREGILGHPENLHPFNSFRDVSSFWRLCTLPLAENHFGHYEIFRPEAALKIEERACADNPELTEYWVHLRDNLFWQPLKSTFFPKDFTLSPHFLKRHPLTAYDYKFHFDAVMNPYLSESKAASLRTYLSEIEEFRVIDPLTFVVRWKAEKADKESKPKVKYAAFSLTASLQPLPCFVYQYFSDGQKIVEEDSDPETYRKDSTFAQNFSTHFAKNVIPSCGPWVFDGMTEEKICFKRNPSHYNPYGALFEGLCYSFKQTPEAIWHDTKAGHLDVCNLSPSQLPELTTFLESPLYKTQSTQKSGLKEIDFVGMSYFYVGWNQETAFFNETSIRKAMTLAIDRNRIISQNLNEMGVAISGPFFPYSPSYDDSISPWPFDPKEAKALLDKALWIDEDGDGVREKTIEGRQVRFSFTLDYYAKNLATKALCDYISTALKQVGIECKTRGLDITDLSRAFEDKTFDAIVFGWSLGTPPEDPKQLWHSSGAKEKGSSNAIGFQNAEVDKIIAALQYEYDTKKRRDLYHRFHRIIHEECPYTFLYAPKSHLLYREYIENVFIPRERSDLVENAESSEPDFRVTWMR